MPRTIGWRHVQLPKTNFQLKANLIWSPHYLLTPRRHKAAVPWLLRRKSRSFIKQQLNLYPIYGKSLIDDSMRYSRYTDSLKKCVSCFSMRCGDWFLLSVKTDEHDSSGLMVNRASLALFSACQFNKKSISFKNSQIIASQLHVIPDNDYIAPLHNRSF